MSLKSLYFDKKSLKGFINAQEIQKGIKRKISTLKILILLKDKNSSLLLRPLSYCDRGEKLRTLDVTDRNFQALCLSSFK